MDEPLDCTYHSHTKRCGHAFGEDEDYAKAAVEGHYQILGYSDHIMLPGREQPGMRGTFSQADGYFASVRNLESKYAGKLKIYCAFEAEWYGEIYAQYYHDLLAQGKVDYLLLGQHCFILGSQIYFYGSLPDKADATRLYAKAVLEGIKSHDFLYVAHPDLFMSWYGTWDLLAEETAKLIIAAAKEAKMPLEVNMGPSRWGRKNLAGQEIEVAYPCPRFWDLVSASGVPVIIGVDSHNPNELLESPFDWVRTFVEKHRLNTINRIAIPSKAP
jgi:histidinol-phosphatase (PHP family)